MNEAKEELLKVKHMSLKIEQLSREREALLGLKGVVKGEKVQSSMGCGSVESVVIRRMKLQERIQELIASYIERRQIVIETIHKLDNNLYIQILYKR